jgi:hypothetical protein
MTDSWLSLWLRGSCALAIGVLRIWTSSHVIRPEQDPQPLPSAPATKEKSIAPQSFQFRERKPSAVAKRRSKQRRKSSGVSRRRVGATKARARSGKKVRR